MKKIIISIFCLLVYSYSFSQVNSNIYLELINKADSLYEAKDYKNAAFTFSSAFRIAVSPPTINDRWTAAGSWSLSNYNDSAFSQLSYISNSNNLTYSKASDILTDEDFTDLKTDNRWRHVKNEMFLTSYKTFLSNLKENGVVMQLQNEQIFSLALGNNDDSAFLHLNNTAYQFLRKRMFDKAYKLFRVSIDNFPPNYILFQIMVDYYKATGDKERAYIYFSRAEVVKYKKANIFSDTTLKIDSAIKAEYRNFSNNIGREFLAPEYLVTTIANALLKKGMADRAFTLFKLNLTNYPYSFALYEELGNYYSRRDNKEKANEYFLKSLILQYKLPENFFQSSFNVKEYIQTHYEDLLMHRGDRILFSETFFNSVGNYFLFNKMYDKAEVLFQTSMEKYPQSLNVYNRMSAFYKATGDKVKEEEFKKQAQALKTTYQQRGITGNDILPDTIYNTQVTKPVCPEKNCPTILLKNNRRWSKGRYKPFANLMANDGYRVILNQGPFTKQSLSQANVVVIIGALEGEELNKDEIKNINDWIHRGGSLLAITHHDEFLFDKFLQSLGVQTNEVIMTSDSAHALAVDGLSASTFFLVFSEKDKLLGNHPIIRGRNDSEKIKVVKTFGGGRSIVGPPGSEVLLPLSESAVDYMTIDPRNPTISRVPVKTKGQRSFGIAFTLGKGRVVVISNAPTLTASLSPPDWGKFGMNTPASDNRQLALNIMRWLTGYLK